MNGDVTAAPETLESYRPLLFAIAYQMTGSASEAEDLVQETYLRHQQAQLHGEIHSLKAFLTTVIVHLSIDYVKSSRHQRECYVGVWLPEPVLTADAASLPSAVVERREAVSMAFLILLATLTPPERAVFLLREVFEYPYETIASIIGKSVTACRQIFHRSQQQLATQRRHFETMSEVHQALVTLLGRQPTGRFRGIAAPSGRGCYPVWRWRRQSDDGAAPIARRESRRALLRRHHPKNATRYAPEHVGSQRHAGAARLGGGDDDNGFTFRDQQWPLRGDLFTTQSRQTRLSATATLPTGVRRRVDHAKVPSQHSQSDSVSASPRETTVVLGCEFSRLLVRFPPARRGLSQMTGPRRLMAEHARKAILPHAEYDTRCK
jgi:RNA polymerase sigma factor (sigma-70 family)